MKDEDLKAIELETGKDTASIMGDILEMLMVKHSDGTYSIINNEHITSGNKKEVMKKWRDQEALILEAIAEELSPDAKRADAEKLLIDIYGTTYNNSVVSKVLNFVREEEEEEEEEEWDDPHQHISQLMRDGYSEEDAYAEAGVPFDDDEDY